MHKQFNTSLVWFRRDLRLHDHSALFHALAASRQVLCVFIFDSDILQHLPPDDRRLAFIHASLTQLAQALDAAGGQLLVRHARAEDDIPRLAQQWQADAVFCNHDYEPAAIARDARVAATLKQDGRQLLTFKDQVIFEKHDILNQSRQPFAVFTPYKNAWLKRFAQEDAANGLPCYRFAPQAGQLLAPPDATIPGLDDIGFGASNLAALALPVGMHGAQQLLQDFAARIAQYGQKRDFPALKGPSYLSTHLRFGTVSIRELVRLAWHSQLEHGAAGAQATHGAQVWLSELIWREFYQMILFHHPHVVTHAFKPAFDAIEWASGAQADDDFAAWCAGQTGYPLVDAAMLQLNQSGYMHNRLRMVTACFLIKDLGIDWRRGEAYFAQQLLDFDLAANNGGWQWASSSGCDAQPWFRIFNPLTQSEKFDADGRFIKRYLPQLAQLSGKEIHAPWLAKPLVLQAAGVTLGKNYPLPLVQHASARLLTLARYEVVKQAASELVIGGDDEARDRQQAPA